MRGGRRAQVTLFVLIGIVVLAVFIFLYAIRGKLAPDDTGFDAYTSLETGAIDEYVDACIDQAWNDVVKRMARQGGLLFEGAPDYGLHSQENNLEASYTVPGGPTTRTSFGLVPESGRNRPWPVMPSGAPHGWYPIENFKFYPEGVARLKGPTPLHDGPFGEYSLPPLCDRDGPNNAGEDNSNFDCDTTLISRPFSVHGPSIQESMRSALQRKIFQCIDVDAIAEPLGVEIAPIGANDVNVTLLFTRKESIVDLDLSLTPTGSEGSIQKEHFSRAYPVRLHNLFQFLHQLLKREAYDPFFDLNKSDDYRSIPSFDRFSVSVNEIPNTDLSLVDVNDYLSSVEGSSLHFEFLLYNRAPVLNHVEDQDFTGNGNTFTVQAIDPDMNQALDIKLMHSSTDYILTKTSTVNQATGITTFTIVVNKDLMLSNNLDDGPNDPIFNLVLTDPYHTSSHPSQDQQAITINLVS